MSDKMDKLLTGFYEFKKSMEERMDNLETKVDRGFAEVDEKFAEIDKRFDRIDAKLEEHDDTFEEFFKRIGSVRRIAGENMRDVEDLSEKYKKMIG